MIDQKSLGSLRVNQAANPIASFQHVDRGSRQREVQLDRSGQPGKPASNDGDAGVRFRTQSTLVLAREVHQPLPILAGCWLRTVGQSLRDGHPSEPHVFVGLAMNSPTVHSDRRNNDPY